jgi:hypothetical protein
VKASGCGMHDAQLAPFSWAPIDILRYATEGLRNATTQYTIDDEATEHHPTPESKEATLISDRGVPFNITVPNAKEGTRGGKKRHK